MIEECDNGDIDFFDILWLIEECDDGDILTFSILWLIGESDDGDFDFFDVVIEWGEWLIGERIGCIATETRSNEV